MTPAWLLWLDAVSAAGDEIVLAVARLSVLAAVVMLVVGAGIAPPAGGSVGGRGPADGGKERRLDDSDR